MQVHAFTFNPFQENTYIVSGDSKSCVIIDPGCYDRSEQQALKRFIEEKGLQVKAVWNTHCHIDHVLGNAFCCATWNVELYAHREELFTLSLAERSAMMYGLEGYVSSPEPTHWFEDGQEIAVDDIRFTVIFGPGHCVGHVAFYSEEEHFLIGGDILFKGSFGRTDLPGGDMEVLKKTIHERMFTLPENTVVYPGHGPATTIGEEKRTNYILEF
jgi:hydroxyacylglutathione hydrolase